MGKKHKAKVKEIERLRALYGEVQANANQGPASVSQVGSVSSVSAKVISTDNHDHIRKDLIGLIILIVVMVAVLIGLNWMVVSTGFSGWLIGLFGA
jgi:hypothetical protein